MTAAPTFALPPLARAASPDALQGWFADPRGAAATWLAEGDVKPVHHLGWITAEAWERAGLVRIVGARQGPQAEFHWSWSVERLGGSVSARAADASPAPTMRRASGGRGGSTAEPVTSDGEGARDAMMRLIRRRANAAKSGFKAANGAAPSLTELADIAELRSAAAADYWLQKLASAGRLRIEKRVMAGGEARRFVIVDAHGFDDGATDWRAPVRGRG